MERQVFKKNGQMVKIAVIVALVAFFAPKQAFAGDLSPHFSRAEFNQHRNPLPLNQVKVDPKLVERLEVLRAMVGKPITLNSGYRSPEYNKKVGGAGHSQHMQGKAADIMVAGMTSKELQVLAKKAGFTFTQTYPHLPHLHVDVR